MPRKPKSTPVCGKMWNRSNLPSFDESQGTPVIAREKPYSVDLDKLNNRIEVLEELAKEGYDGLTLDNIIIRLKAVKNHYLKVV